MKIRFFLNDSFLGGFLRIFLADYVCSVKIEENLQFKVHPRDKIVNSFVISAVMKPNKFSKLCFINNLTMSV